MSMFWYHKPFSLIFFIFLKSKSIVFFCHYYHVTSVKLIKGVKVCFAVFIQQQSRSQHGCEHDHKCENEHVTDVGTGIFTAWVSVLSRV